MNRLVHYLLGFPFPTPAVLFPFALGAALGLLLGLLYHRIWPLPPRWGRMVRLFVLLPPAFVLGWASWSCFRRRWLCPTSSP